MVHEGGGTVLLDPLFEDPSPIDPLIAGEVVVAVTIPYQQRRAWFRSTGAPALAHLLDLDFDRVPVTHGDPVLAGGRQALQNALNDEPWYHRPT